MIRPVAAFPVHPKSVIKFEGEAVEPSKELKKLTSVVSIATGVLSLICPYTYVFAVKSNTDVILRFYN